MDYKFANLNLTNITILGSASTISFEYVSLLSATYKGCNSCKSKFMY